MTFPRLRAQRALPLMVMMLLGGTAAPPAGAGVNSFTFTGPEGGLTYDIAVQPGHPEVVLASVAGRGMYRTSDGGASWSLVSPERIGTIEWIAFDPLTPDRVYALGNKFWRSLDAGRTFTEAGDVPTRPNSLAVSGNRIYLSSINGDIRRSDDDAQTWTTLTVPWVVGTASILYGIAADPANDNVLYACLPGTGIYKTIDHGDHWTPPATGPCQVTPYDFTWRIVVSPADSNRVIAPTSDGLYLSTTGGASWTKVINGPSLQRVEFDPAAPGNVIGVSQGDGRIWRSNDGGLTWPMHGANLNLNEVKGAMYTGGTAGHLYIASPTGPLYSADNGDTVVPRLAGIQAAVARDVISADDGTIYSLLTSGQVGLWRRAPNSWVALDNAELLARQGFPLSPMAIATAAGKSSLLYYADQNRLFRSVNGGADWTGPPSSLDIQVFGIGVDPTNPQVAYAAPATGGLRRSVDGGLTWTACGLESNVPIAFLRVDRSAPDIIYAAGYYPPYNFVYKSTDHCQSWAVTTAAFQYPINDVVVHPVDHNRIFVVSYDGVRESRDSGATWQPLHFNLSTGDSVVGMRLLIDPLLPSTMWVINGDQSGFTRSVDDGVTWQTVEFRSGGYPVSLQNGVLDPLQPDTLVAGAPGFGLVEYQVAPDLELLMDQPQADLPAGANVSPSVGVHNLGPLDASAADIDISLPDFLTMLNPPAACTKSGANFRCHVGPIKVGGVARIELPLSISGVGSGAIHATLTGHEADPVAANNTVTRATNAVRYADLEMVAPATLTIGHGTNKDIDYSITNHGPAMAANTGATFSLSEGLQAVSANSPAGTCTLTTPRLVNCLFGFLDANRSAAVRLRVTGVDAGAREILADAVGDVTDTNQDQHARTAVEVRKLANLSVLATTDNSAKTPGAPFQYTVSVRNNGPDAVNSHVDFAITGATVNSVSAPIAGCVTAPTVRCTLAQLVNGGTVDVLLTLTAASAGTVSGEVTITGTDGDVDDPDSTNNKSTFATTVTAPGGSGGAGGGGGGGGGRFDWLALGLLGAVAWWRRVQRPMFTRMSRETIS